MSKYILAIHNGIQETNTPPVDVNNYPNVKAFMDSKIDILKKRQDKGYTIYNLRSCAYMDNFYKQKLVWTAVNSEYRFAIVPEGIFLNNSLFMITGESIEYLLGVLNSTLFKYYISIMLSGENYAYGSATFFEQIKVLRLDKNEFKDKILELVNNIIKNVSENNDTREQQSELDKLIYKVYNITQEEVNKINEYLNI